ncbi:MAG: TM2 domain-containing protein [Planctomycetota bacterium]
MTDTPPPPPPPNPEAPQPPAPPQPAPQSTPPKDPSSTKTAAGVLGIVVGAFGVHKFILGYPNEGAIMLGVSLGGLVLGLFAGLLCCLFLPLLLAPGTIGIIGLIEGITYLSMSDEDFERTYLINRKPWF